LKKEEGRLGHDKLRVSGARSLSGCNMSGLSSLEDFW